MFKRKVGNFIIIRQVCFLTILGQFVTNLKLKCNLLVCDADDDIARFKFYRATMAGHYKCATRKDKDGQKKYVLYSFYDSLPEYPAQVELLSRPLDSLGVDAEFAVPATIRNSITEFIEVVNADEGVRQSLIGSLKLQNESLLDEYLKVLGESFIAE